MKKSILFYLFLLCNILTVFAQKDSLKVTLITISPGEQVYEKFGHTALRVQELNGRFDIVFNYGLFSFEAPNFLYRFIKGETDYQLGVVETGYFLTEYAMRGSEVTEQTINLTPAESEHLFNLVKENYKEENRVYRYNFFFDNCSTRPRDIILKSVSGNIGFKNEENKLTFRDLIYEKTGGENNWLSFGIDLLMGANTDRVATNEELSFLPDYLMITFDSTFIVKDSITYPLVSDKKIIFEKEEYDENSNLFISPFFICSILLVLFGILFVIELKRGKMFTFIDSSIFIIAGLVGIIVYFLNFFSQHPCVDNNYNCIWLQPLDIVAGILVWVKSTKKILYYYHFANFVLLFIFLVFCLFIPQHLNLAFYPLIMIIMSRSLQHILMGRRDVLKGSMIKK